MEKNFIEILKQFLTQQVKNGSFECNYCNKKIVKGGYRYKCLECEDYDLCTHCFESKKCNENHESNHIFAIFYNDELLFGEKQSSDDEYHVEALCETYKSQVHEGVKCNICSQEPIKGLRLKCAFCNNLDFCYSCRFSTTHSHLANHSYVLYCKTVQSLIDKNDVTYTEKDKLGEGAFGSVYKAQYKDQTVACKIIREELSLLNILLGQFGTLKKSYLRELEAYKQIKGENIIRMIGHCTYAQGNISDFMILTEFMSKGSLDKLLKNEPQLTPRRRFNIAANVAAGMAKIHKLSFIHKDIRPANVFISGQYVAKIGDMGIARLLDTGNVPSLLGPVRYMPPEFYTRTYTHKLDVYTFGLTLVELFDGAHTIKNTTITVSKKPTALWDIIERCVSNNPSRRPKSSFIDERLDFCRRYINEKIDSNREYFQVTHEKRCEMFMDLYSKALTSYEEKCEEENRKSKNENRNRYINFFKNEYKIKEAFYNYKEHNELLYIIEKIASGYFRRKDFKKCNSVCLKGIHIAEKLIKGDSVMKSNFYNYIGRGLISLKIDPNSAIEYFTRSLNMRKQIIDYESPKVASSLTSLGKCYFDKKDYNTALTYFSKAYDIRKNIYDEENMYYENILSLMIKTYNKLNDFENSEKLFLIAQKIKRNKFQKKNLGQQFSTLYFFRGRDKGRPNWYYIEIKDDQKLLELKRLRNGTNIDVTKYGEVVVSGWGENPSALIVKSIQSSYESSKEELSIEGLPSSYSEDDNPLFVYLFNELIEEWEFFAHKPCLEVLKELEFIERYYFSIRDARNTILYCKKRLEMSINLFKEENEYTSTTRYDLGRSLRKLARNYEEALENLRISQNTQENLYGKENFLVAASIFEIAQCYYDQKKFKEALDLGLNALKIREKVYNVNNPFLAFSLDQVSNCYENLGNNDKYLEYRNKSLKIKRHLFKMTHPDSDYLDYFKIVNKESSVSTWKIVLIKDEEAFQELKKNKRNVEENIKSFGEVIHSGKGDRPPNKLKEIIDKQYGWF